MAGLIVSRVARPGARERHIKDNGTANFLVCPRCGGALKKTVDSRPTVFSEREIPAVRRARRCDRCGQRASTIELLRDDVEALQRDALQLVAHKILTGQIR